MSFSFKLLRLIPLMGLLAGCVAHAPNVAVKDRFWTEKKASVAVADAKQVNKPGLIKIGQQGLLDLAINNMMTNTFNTYLSHQSEDWYTDMRHQIATRLRKNHIRSTEIKRPVSIAALKENSQQDLANYTRENFAPIAARLGKDKLLLIQINEFGAERAYFGFIPKGAPTAVCSLEGRIIDLKNNKIEWRFQSKLAIPVKGEWDQPPHYANFQKALNVAVKTTTQELMDSLFSSAAI